MTLGLVGGTGSVIPFGLNDILIGFRIAGIGVPKGLLGRGISTGGLIGAAL